jgi:hypothetical protein
LDKGLETDDRYDGCAGCLLAKCDAMRVSRKDASKSEQRVTYNVPTLNIMIMYNFFFILNDRRNSSGIGTARIVTSRTMLIAACAQAKT